MDYEKKYKLSLDRIKVLIANVESSSKDCISIDDIKEIYPELAESEDERIRKELIQNLKERFGTKGTMGGNLDMPKVIAYLEKQGEQKSGDIIRHKKQGFTCKIIAVDNEYRCNGTHLPIEWQDAYELVEHKPDKVEPKFCEGEWLCENEPNNYARFIQILEIVNVQGKDRYRISRDIHNDEDIVEFDFVEKYYHKFDIQDAKDGDILMANAPFIFNGNLEGGIGCPGAHCAINTLGKFQIPKYPEHWTGHTTTPATKEQRDQLEKAMTDAGYAFDFEKKELKKIEQKPAEEYDITGIGSKKAQGKLGEMIKNLKPVNKVLEQKPWSEEDNIMVHDIDYALRCQITYPKSRLDSMSSWIYNLKNRVQPQPRQEWSEEDEKMLSGIINDFSDELDEETDEID